MLYGAELIKSQVLFRTAHKGQTAITINTDHVLIKLQLVFPGVARWFNVDYIYLFTSSSELPSFWFAVTLRFNRKGRKYFSWFSCWRSTVRPTIKIVVFWLNCLSPTIHLTHLGGSAGVYDPHTHTPCRGFEPDLWPLAAVYRHPAFHQLPSRSDLKHFSTLCFCSVFIKVSQPSFS